MKPIVLELLLVHLRDDDAEHVLRTLRDRHGPRLAVGLRRRDHRRRRDVRHLEFGRDRGHSGRRRRAGGADEHVDLVFLDQLAGVLGGR